MIPKTTSHEPTAGAMLRAARRHRGFTIAEVAAALRIPVRQLQSLEEDALTVFTAEVYARGVFQAYVRYLGIAGSGVERVFARAMAQVREAVPVKFLVRRRWLSRVLTPRWILTMAGAVAALVVGGYVIWQVQSFLRLPALEVTEPISGVVAVRQVWVKGYAELTAAVTVNEQPVLLKDDGSFELGLELHPGVTRVQVEAKNAAGRRRVIMRDLLVPRQDGMF